MSESVLYKEVKERYEKELQRKIELNNMVSIPVGLIPVLIGALAYFFNNLPQNSNNVLYVVFWIFLVVSVCCVAGCLIGFWRHQTGYVYAYVPDPDILQKYEKDYLESLKNDNDENVDYKKIDEEMDDLLYGLRVEATTKNVNCNEQKIKRYRTLVILIVFSFTFLSLTFILRMGLDSKPSEAIKIQSTMPIDVNIKDSAFIQAIKPIRCDVHSVIQIDNNQKKGTSK